MDRDFPVDNDGKSFSFLCLILLEVGKYYYSHKK